MTHPLVLQLRFIRSEWLRGLDGISDEDARKRLMPMNCISWMIGHLAYQEHTYWFVRAQGQNIAPELEPLVAWDKPASTPPLDEMWAAWHRITKAADPYLDSLTIETLQSRMVVNGKPHVETVGTMLQRVCYHYWYHLGEAMAVRQLLGHANLPEFVGALQEGGPYTPEK